jgi:hypothetical protein
LIKGCGCSLDRFAVKWSVTDGFVADWIEADWIEADWIEADWIVADRMCESEARTYD